jgi:hypothetical protein
MRTCKLLQETPLRHSRCRVYCLHPAVPDVACTACCILTAPGAIQLQSYLEDVASNIFCCRKTQPQCRQQQLTEWLLSQASPFLQAPLLTMSGHSTAA